MHQPGQDVCRARLLISVRSAEESRVALLGGADWIDVKEPRRGALGAASPDVWSDVATAVDGRAPISVAVGELLEGNAAFRASQAPFGQTAKLGLSGCGPLVNWSSPWREAVDALPEGVQTAAVIYADWRRADAPRPPAILEKTDHARRSVVLIDTFHKNGGNLFQHMTLLDLTAVIDDIHQLGLMAAVGGSLTIHDAPLALDAGADVIAVRGAVCNGGRNATIDLQLVYQMSRLVNRYQT